jgi:hypothetical protein
MPGVPPTQAGSAASTCTAAAGGLEQESVDLLLMQECERTQFLRQREGEQVVVTGKQARA